MSDEEDRRLLLQGQAYGDPDTILPVTQHARRWVLHQSHDDQTVTALVPALHTVNRRLMPLEAAVAVLSASAQF